MNSICREWNDILMEFFEIEKLVVGEKILSFTKVQKKDTFCPLCVVQNLQKTLIMRTEGRDVKSRDRANFPPHSANSWSKRPFYAYLATSSFLTSFQEYIENTELI